MPPQIQTHAPRHTRRSASISRITPSRERTDGHIEVVAEAQYLLHFWHGAWGNGGGCDEVGSVENLVHVVAFAGAHVVAINELVCGFDD